MTTSSLLATRMVPVMECKNSELRLMQLCKHGPGHQIRFPGCNYCHRSDALRVPRCRMDRKLGCRLVYGMMSSFIGQDYNLGRAVLLDRGVSQENLLQTYHNHGLRMGWTPRGWSFCFIWYTRKQELHLYPEYGWDFGIYDFRNGVLEQIGLRTEDVSWLPGLQQRLQERYDCIFAVPPAQPQALECKDSSEEELLLSGPLVEVPPDAYQTVVHYSIKDFNDLLAREGHCIVSVDCGITGSGGGICVTGRSLVNGEMYSCSGGGPGSWLPLSELQTVSASGEYVISVIRIR